MAAEGGRSRHAPSSEAVQGDQQVSWESSQPGVTHVPAPGPPGIFCDTQDFSSLVGIPSPELKSDPWGWGMESAFGIPAAELPMQPSKSGSTVWGSY